LQRRALTRLLSRIAYQANVLVKDLEPEFWTRYWLNPTASAFFPRQEAVDPYR